MVHDRMEVVQQGKGTGIVMAENEILSHCELLQTSGDAVPCTGRRFEATGTSSFEPALEALRPEW
jgi:hypothetical protein